MVICEDEDWCVMKRKEKNRGKGGRKRGIYRQQEDSQITRPDRPGILPACRNAWKLSPCRLPVPCNENDVFHRLSMAVGPPNARLGGRSRYMARVGPGGGGTSSLWACQDRRDCICLLTELLGSDSLLPAIPVVGDWDGISRYHLVCFGIST